MKRSASNDRPTWERITRIELPTGQVKLRVVVLILLILIAVISMGYGVNALLITEPGIQEITVLSGEMNCGDEFTFYYDLGGGDISATEEQKALRTLYSQTATDALRLFSADAAFEGCQNLWDVNHRVNEAVVVSGALYEALSLLENSGTRYHYLGPVYEIYQALFLSSDDSEAAEYDPYLNEELKSFFAETAVFVNDPEAVELELLGENTVRLQVSEDYLRFAEENGITRFVDLFWMKNAFIADYMAEILVEAGYTRGTLMSVDGFIRSLGEVPGAEFTFTLSHREGNVISEMAVLPFSQAVNMVYLHDYPLGGGNYYVREDGTIRSPFVDTADGLCKSALPELAAWSSSRSCGEILLEIAPLYIADTLDEKALASLDGIEACYCEGQTVRYTAEER